MEILLEIVLPVFLVIGAGYGATWAGWFTPTGIDGLVKFTQNFAIPCLLFRAISGLDLGQEFQWPLLVSFYSGAICSFCVLCVVARFLFHRDWPAAIAIGFAGLFSNSVLLGLPINERAYGAEVLPYAYAIIAIHAPICYGIGVTCIEIARGRGVSARAVTANVTKSMFRNALVIGIALGFAVNLSGFTLPVILSDAVDLMVQAALPTALFGLGGILFSYQTEGDWRLIGWVCMCSLLLHPSLAFLLSSAFALDPNAQRAAVLTAAMAPGVNSYIFANLYGVGMRIAASSVLIATALSIVSASIWIAVLP